MGNMGYLLFIITLCIVFGFGIRVEKTEEESVILNRLNGWRGIAAILIIIGHCSMRFEKEPTFLLIIHKTNMTWVSFFLLVSGWGMACSYYNKKNYLKNFLIKKVGYLGGISLLAGIISALLNVVYFHQNTKLLSYINWYVYEACFFYVIFYLIYRMIHKKNIQMILFWISAAVICITAYLNNWEHAYYYSAFSFPLGITLHNYWKSMKNSKKISIIGIGFIIVGIALYSYQDYMLVNIFLHNIFGIGFCLLCVMLCKYIQVKNKITIILCRVSAELYLYQFIILKIWKEIFTIYNYKINLTYVILVLMSCILSSQLVWRIDNKFRNWIANYGMY